MAKGKRRQSRGARSLNAWARLQSNSVGASMRSTPLSRSLRLEQLEDRRVLATFVVNNLGDLDADQNTVTGSFRNAVEQANSNPGFDTIVFADFLFDDPLSVNPNGGLEIFLDGRDSGGALELTDVAGVSILGPGPGTDDFGLALEGRLQIHAGGNNRIFVVNDGDDDRASSVTISGVTLSGGSPQPDDNDGLGGAIYNVEFLTISGVELRDNFAPEGGGAVHNATGVLTIENSLIRDNTSRRGGGGVQTGEPDQEDDLPTTMIVNSTITGNVALGVPNDDTPTGYGGGVYNRAGTTNIEQSTIYGNQAAIYGGGVGSRGFDPEVDDEGVAANESGLSTTNIRSSIIVGNTLPPMMGMSVPDDVGSAGMTDDDPPGPFDPQINSFGYNIFGVLSFAPMTANGNVILPPGGPDDIANVDPTTIFIDDPSALTPEAWLNDFGGILPVFMPDINKLDPNLGVNAAIDRGDPNLVRGEFDQRGSLYARRADITGTVVLPTLPAMDIGAAELQNGTFSVTTVVDETDGKYGAVAISEGTFPFNILTFVPDLSLREALEQAEKNLATGVTATSVITFDPSLADTLSNPDPVTSTDPQTILLDEGELSITVPVIIEGPTSFELEIDAAGNDTIPSVPGGGGSRVFSIIAETEISNLILRGADSQEFGGAITSNADLTLRQVTVRDNFNTGSGGGIYIAGGTVLIESSTINDNTSAISGGGIFVASGDLTLRNSTVSGNVGTFAGGGVANYNGSVRIEYSTITNNTASSTFGSGIVSYRDGAATTEIRSSIISGNTINDVNHFLPGANNIVSLGYNLVGDGNAVVDGVFASSGDQTFADALLAPLARLGGPTEVHRLLPGSPALDAGDPNAAGLGNVPLFDQRGFPFDRVENGVRIDIGAYEDQDGMLLVGDVSMDPTAGFSFFLDALAESNLTPVKETIVFLPSWLGEAFPDDILITDSVEILGDNNGIRFFSTNLIIDDGDEANLIDVTIDDLRFDTDVHVDSNENLTLTNVQFVDNAATVDPTTLEVIDGGAITHRTGKLTISDARFIGNSSSRHGGAVFVENGNFEINNSLISGSSTGTTDGSGGAIYIKDGTFTADSLYLTGNVAPGATGMGGALYAKNSTVMLTGATVSGNATAGSNSDGGAIAGINSDITITDSALAFNTTIGTQSSGGAVYVDGGSLSLLDSSFSLNSTFGQDASGGAVAANDATVSILSSSLNSNAVNGIDSHGGAVSSVGGTLEIRNSSLTFNSTNQSSTSGGAIFSQKLLSDSAQNALIINSTISGNESAHQGGGVFNAGGALQIKYSTITNNSVPYFGGGGGVASSGSTISSVTQVGSSIIAGNDVLNDPVNIHSDVDTVDSPITSFQSLGYNVIGTGVQFTLDAFSAAGDQVGIVDHGLEDIDFDVASGTFFHAIASEDSPAVNAGNPSAQAGVGDVPEFDQRGTGAPRIFNAVRLDAGAIESDFGPLTPLITGPDFDNDGDVDGSDFLAWQRGFGMSVGAVVTDGDADGDGAVDADDLAIWTTDYGNLTVLAVSSGEEETLAAILADSEPIDTSPVLDVEAAQSALTLTTVASAIDAQPTEDPEAPFVAANGVRDDLFAVLSFENDYRSTDEDASFGSPEYQELEVSVEDQVFGLLGA